MPEGPEVRLVAEWLHKRYNGYNIDSIEAVSNMKLKGSSCYGMIHEVRSKGKSILFFTTTCIIESKLAMEGKWLRFPDKYVKFIVTMSKYVGDISVTTQLYYSDMRSFGSLTIHTNMDDINKRVGIDLLECSLNNVSVDDLLPTYITYASKCSKDVTYFLMNQKHFAGVGNYLKAEILYAVRIHPQRKVNSLSHEELKLMLTTSMQLLQQSYKCNGLTIRTYIPPNGGVGSFHTHVYGKSIDPHGYDVITGTFDDGRITYYCPTLQKQ